MHDPNDTPKESEPSIDIRNPGLVEACDSVESTRQVILVHQRGLEAEDQALFARMAAVFGTDSENEILRAVKPQHELGRGDNNWQSVIAASLNNDEMRELAVARALAAGKTSRDVAAENDISVHTVVEYTRRIYRKLGVKSGSQLATRLSKA